MPAKNFFNILKQLRPTHPEELKYYEQHLPRYLLTLKDLEPFIFGKTVADLGVIPGHMALACKQLGAAQVWGLDYDPERFGFGEKFRARGLKILKCDLENGRLPLPNDSIDLLLFTEVIEHLSRNASEILTECRRVLKTGGVLVLTTPNVKNLANRIRKLFRKPIYPAPEALGVKPQQRHHREYAAGEISAMLSAAGLKIIKKKYLPGTERAILNNVFFSALPRQISRLYALLALACPPFRSYLFFLAKK